MNPFVRWMKQQFRANPGLQQKDLARHLNRSKGVVTHMLKGERQIKADEWEKIEEFFGSRFTPPQQTLITVERKIGRAWYEEAEKPEGNRNDDEAEHMKVSSVVNPVIDGVQVAFELETYVPDLDMGAGTIVIAVMIDGRHQILPTTKIVYARHRTGFVNYNIGMAASVLSDKSATPIAIVIEARQTIR